MRVSDRQLFELASRRSGDARERATAATEEAASGLRLLHPQDDPYAAGQVLLERSAANREQGLADSTARASDELGLVDGSLGGVGNLLTRARELAMQLGNSTYTSRERTAAAQEVQGLFQDALGLLNVRSGTRYVFGGMRDDAPPFDPSGAYQGDTNVRQLEVAPGQYQDVSVRADTFIQGAGGGVNILSTLQALATALTANDETGIRATLDGLDESIQQVALARSSTGAMLSALDTLSLSARERKASAVESASKLEDADAIDSASRLALAQRALDAALTASAQSFRLTLLDKLS